MPEERLISLYVYRTYTNDRGCGFSVSGEKETDSHTAGSGYCDTIEKAARYSEVWTKDKLSGEQELRFKIFFTHRDGDHIHVWQYGACSYWALTESEIDAFHRAFMPSMERLACSATT